MRSPTKAFLKKAVHHNKAVSKAGMLERLFTLWFNGFVYNQIWEDPRVDATAMELDEHSRILAISSGGCNILNYLAHKPEKIVAVDLNICHMSLTRLKLAGIKHLPSYEDFYTFFGHGDVRQNVQMYDQHLRPNLDDTTRQYWESRRWISKRVGSRRIHYFAKGFYDYSKLGQFIRFVHLLARVTRRDPQAILRATSHQEQIEIYERDIAPFFENRMVRFLGKLPVTVFSLGIPPSQHQVMKDDSNGQIVDLFEGRLRKLACGFPLEDNYFTWQAFGRSYDHQTKQALPTYLQEANFQTLRDHAGNVETHIISLIEYLHQQPDNSLNRFVLLDSQDWMPPHVIADLWGQIARVGQPGSRVIFRTAGDGSPIEAALPHELMHQYTYDRELSRKLHDQDRSAIYGMFHMYHLNK